MKLPLAPHNKIYRVIGSRTKYEQLAFGIGYFYKFAMIIKKHV